MGVALHLLRDLPWAALRLAAPFVALHYFRTSAAPPAEQQAPSKAGTSGAGTHGAPRSEPLAASTSKPAASQAESCSMQCPLLGGSAPAAGAASKHRTTPPPLLVVEAADNQQPHGSKPCTEEALQRVLAMKAKGKCVYKSPYRSHRVVLKLDGLDPADLATDNLISGIQQTLIMAG